MSPSGSVPCMEGGYGEHNYAHNSLLQNFNFHSFAKPRLSQALDHLSHNLSESLALHLKRRHAQPHSTESSSTEDDTYNHAHHPVLQDHDHSTSAKADHYASKHVRPGQMGTALQHQCNTTTVLQLNVADFGCSFGHNTLDYTAHIVNGLHTRLADWLASNPASHQAAAPPRPAGAEHTLIQAAAHDPCTVPAQLDVEVQYFFSDLPSNNFNVLFQSFQPFLQQLLLEISSVSPLSFRLFSGAVAGSFHRQLFPTGSLHLAISSYSLQWLSQVPPEVVDRASSAWNGGHIWIHGTRPKVVQAYARQFRKDMKSFLLSRAAEMAEGGILFLFFPGRTQMNPEGALFTPHHDIWTGCFEATWEEMVVEGLISREERDMFNLPFYNCHKMEMQEVLNEFSNEFHVLYMEVLPNCNNLPREEEEMVTSNPQAFGKFVATFVGSLMKPMVQKHLDESRTLDLFRRLKIQAAKRAHLSTCIAYDMLLAIIQRV